MAAAFGICMALALGLGQPVAAQSFDSLPGLERAVVRAYIAPNDESIEVSVVETNDQGTPLAKPEIVQSSTPDVATPDSATVSGVVFLSIGVFEFDSADSATSAFDTLARFAVDVSSGDPQFAGGTRTELDGIGDQSIHATATQMHEDIPFSYLFTVVRSDRYVYLIQGTLVRQDATEEARRLLPPMIENPAGDAAAFDPSGKSTGGLWDKYIGVEPVLIEGSDIFDVVVFPTDVNA
jgi:hypothetical protein